MNSFLLASLVIGAGMLALWLLSLRLRDAGIVDSFWGLGFVLLGWLYFVNEGSASQRGLLVAGLTTVWGVRLAVHIFRRNHGGGEDYRYAAMRAKWGPRFWWVSGLVVFGLQGTLMLLIGLPQLAASQAPPMALGLVEVAGIALFVGGFLFEVIGDRQLKQFKADPSNRGTTLQSGLWRYTRHPNYFGDALLWWGLFVIGGASTGAWWTIVSPLIMTFLLTRVSGVPMLEERMRQTKPDFADYAERTNAFFPWPPRSHVNRPARQGAR